MDTCFDRAACRVLSSFVFINGNQFFTLFFFHRYVHVAFHELEERPMAKPCSLIICGPGEGQTDQYACAFRDAIRMLLTTLEPIGITATTASKMTLQSYKNISSNVSPSQQSVLESGCVIPAGGAFEFLLHHTLLQYGTKSSVSDNTNKGVPTISQLFAQALLSVPRKIYSHRPQHFLHTQTRILSFIRNNSHPVLNLLYNQENTSPTLDCASSDCPQEDHKISMHCYRKADISSNFFMLDSGLESVSCKYQLLLAVLQCVTSVLRVGAVLSTHTSLHTQPDRLANIL